jgi:hypothetical protein
MKNAPDSYYRGADPFYPENWCGMECPHPSDRDVAWEKILKQREEAAAARAAAMVACPQCRGLVERLLEDGLCRVCSEGGQRALTRESGPAYWLGLASRSVEADQADNAWHAPRYAPTAEEIDDLCSWFAARDPGWLGQFLKAAGLSEVEAADLWKTRAVLELARQEYLAGGAW